jgi:hypothetical protein
MTDLTDKLVEALEEISTDNSLSLKMQFYARRAIAALTEQEPGEFDDLVRECMSFGEDWDLLDNGQIKGPGLRQRCALAIITLQNRIAVMATERDEARAKALEEALKCAPICVGSHSQDYIVGYNNAVYDCKQAIRALGREEG